ncbi:MAG: L-serine ammonia-lyase, iron-sulfur-dependent subunit beta [Lachnospiraceae bacterium]|nr:L-serine ammonia-lyase, iron-sulfur-dependent subunit beta [Lachnospiraceae bacterium]
MDAFDIIGPIMIGPSSSHTAGAVRIGKYAGSILGKKAVKADIYFSGSFAKTYKGHGTDKAIIAGILGMETDDARIRNSIEIAAEIGLDFHFHEVDIDGAHPNTALIELVAEDGKKVSVQGASIGGGNIIITKINDTEVNISGKATTIIVHHRDVPGMISDVTNILARRGVNIGRFELRRSQKGGIAVMIIEIDGNVDEGVNEAISSFPNVTASTILKAI